MCASSRLGLIPKLPIGFFALAPGGMALIALADGDREGRWAIKRITHRYEGMRVRLAYWEPR